MCIWTTERFFILKFGKLTQYFCIKSNFWTIKTVFILVKVCIYVLYTRQWGPGHQRLLQFTYGRPNFETKGLNGWIKIMILRITSIRLTTKFPLILHFWNKNRKRLVVSHRKKYFRQQKRKQTSTCLAAVQLKFLFSKWSQMNFIVLEKP